MSYNIDLQNNNTSLQEILATINNLPEAGSGGSSDEGGSSLEWVDVIALGAISTEYGSEPGVVLNTYQVPILDETRSIIIEMDCSAGIKTYVGCLPSTYSSSWSFSTLSSHESMVGLLETKYIVSDNNKFINLTFTTAATSINSIHALLISKR